MKYSRELKSTIKLSIPVIFTHLGFVLMTVVDTLVVGRVSTLELAAVGTGANVVNPFFVMGIGVLTSLDALISQSYGAGHFNKCRHYLHQGIYSALIVSVPMVLVLLFVSENLAWAQVKPDIALAAQPYIDIVTWSTPLALLFVAIMRYWQAVERVAPMVWIVAAANVGNLVMDLAFVQGLWGFPQLGAEGVGLATFANRVFMVIAAVIYTGLAVRGKRASWRWDAVAQSKIFRIGIPASLQIGAEVSAFAVASILSARLGAIPAAAHNIVLQIVSFTFMVPLGVSIAASVRVGHHIGAGSAKRAQEAGWLAIGMATVYMSLTALTFLILPGPIFGAFSKDPEVFQTGMLILLWGAIFQISDGVQAVTTGALRGLGDTKTAFYTNVIGHYPMGLFLGYALCFHYAWGVVGLWIGLATGLTVVAALNLVFWTRRMRQSLGGRRFI